MFTLHAHSFYSLLDGTIHGVIIKNKKAGLPIRLLCKTIYYFYFLPNATSSSIAVVKDLGLSSG